MCLEDGVSSGNSSGAQSSTPRATSQRRPEYTNLVPNQLVCILVANRVLPRRGQTTNSCECLDAIDSTVAHEMSYREPCFSERF